MKQSLAFNNDDGKKLYKQTKKSIYKKNKKIKTSLLLMMIPSRLPLSDPVHVTFPEMEIKRKLRAIFQLLTRSTFCNLLTDLTCTGSIPNYR